MNDASAGRTDADMSPQGEWHHSAPKALAGKGHTLTYGPHLVNDRAQFQNGPLANI